MDRSRPSSPQHSTAVPTAGSAALDLLLPAAAGKRGEPLRLMRKLDQLYMKLPFFGKSQDGRWGGPSSCPAAHADIGNRSALPQTVSESPGSGPPDLSVPAARHRDQTAQPCLEHRYYLHSDAWRLPVPSRRDGLVQPFCSQLGTIQHDGDQLAWPHSTRPSASANPKSGTPIRARSSPRPTFWLRSSSAGS